MGIKWEESVFKHAKMQPLGHDDAGGKEKRPKVPLDYRNEPLDDGGKRLQRLTESGGEPNPWHWQMDERQLKPKANDDCAGGGVCRHKTFYWLQQRPYDSVSNLVQDRCYYRPLWSRFHRLNLSMMKMKQQQWPQ